MRSFSELEVLIVESDKAGRQLLRNSLAELGIMHATEVEDGEAALQAVRDYRYHVIISEWALPKMDGLELFKAIHTHRATAGIPFIMVTNRIDRPSIEAVKNAGLKLFLAKPYTLGALKGRLEQALDMHRPAQAAH